MCAICARAYHLSLPAFQEGDSLHLQVGKLKVSAINFIEF